jgi:hypothetical protein
MARSSTRKWVRSRWWLAALAAAPFAIAVSGPSGGTAVADCFQRGYQPPPCSAGGQNATSSPTTESAVPDSGVNACQNQAAMATSIGLIPAVCPPTAGGG